MLPNYQHHDESWIRTGNISHHISQSLFPKYFLNISHFPQSHFLHRCLEYNQKYFLHLKYPWFLDYFSFLKDFLNMSHIPNPFSFPDVFYTRRNYGKSLMKEFQHRELLPNIQNSAHKKKYWSFLKVKMKLILIASLLQKNYIENSTCLSNLTQIFRKICQKLKNWYKC